MVRRRVFNGSCKVGLLVGVSFIDVEYGARTTSSNAEAVSSDGFVQLSGEVLGNKSIDVLPGPALGFQVGAYGPKIDVGIIVHTGRLFSRA